MNFDLLNPLSPEVISRQATINIGTIGHVAHGKSTLVQSLSGVTTAKFGKEKERNMTMKLGYANAKIYECDNAECPRPGRYRSGPSNKPDEFPCDRIGCGGKFHLVRHISFVDCPGHETYMAAMLNGVAVMDAAILVIAANEACPRAQTAEHLAAAEIMKLNSLIILQSKIDLVGQVRGEEHRQQIVQFVQKTIAENAPIIPISAQLNGNMDAVCDYLVRKIPVPVRDFSAVPRMTIIRSFDVNKPGTEIDCLKGGIVGGSICQGVFRLNQEIEIRPGLVYKDKEGALQCRPIRSIITSLYAEKNELTFAVPGGLIGVGTKVDPSLCRADGLVGQILGAYGTLPKVYIAIEVQFNLLGNLIGEQTNKSTKQSKLSNISKGEVLLINVGSLASHGKILSVKDDHAKIQLSKPVCAELSDKLALSRRINGHFRLIGWGQICKGKELDTSSST